jgi:hypothetical protein
MKILWKSKGGSHVIKFGNPTAVDWILKFWKQYSWIRDSQGDGYEKYSLLGYDAV